jgi:hypothetical protein
VRPSQLFCRQRSRQHRGQYRPLKKHVLPSPRLAILSRPQQSPQSEPVRGPAPGWFPTVKAAVRHIVHSARHAPPKRPGRSRRDVFNGPDVLTQTLLAGLATSGREFTVDPPRLDRDVDVAHVIAGVDTLQWAIHERRLGSFGSLVAGPTVVGAPFEADEVITDPAIDLVLCASRWVMEMYLACAPCLAGRIAAWSVGVDAAHWRPTAPPVERPIDVLVYDKRVARVFDARRRAEGDGAPPLRDCVDRLQRLGLRVASLSYGDHTRDEYRHALQASRAMLYLSYQETQGIALFEAWSTDVATLVWDAGVGEYLGRTFPASSAPYLSPQTGASRATIDEVLSAAPGFVKDVLAACYSPRRWVLEHGTVESSIERYEALIAGSLSRAVHGPVSLVTSRW